MRGSDLVAIDAPGTPIDRVIHAWPLIAFMIGALMAVWRIMFIRPLNRLTAVEKQGNVLEDKLDNLSQGIDEIRVAQARSSDQHREDLHSLSERIDRALEVIARWDR